MARQIGKKTCRDIRDVIAEAIRGCVEDYDLTMDDWNMAGDPSIKATFAIHHMESGELIELAEFEIGKPKKEVD